MKHALPSAVRPCIGVATNARGPTPPIFSDARRSWKMARAILRMTHPLTPFDVDSVMTVYPGVVSGHETEGLRHGDQHVLPGGNGRRTAVTPARFGLPRRTQRLGEYPRAHSSWGRLRSRAIWAPRPICLFDGELSGVRRPICGCAMVEAGRGWVSIVAEAEMPPWGGASGHEDISLHRSLPACQKAATDEKAGGEPVSGPAVRHAFRLWQDAAMPRLVAGGPTCSAA